MGCNFYYFRRNFIGLLYIEKLIIKFLLVKSKTYPKVKKFNENKEYYVKNSKKNWKETY